MKRDKVIRLFRKRIKKKKEKRIFLLFFLNRSRDAYYSYSSSSSRKKPYFFLPHLQNPRHHCRHSHCLHLPCLCLHQPPPSAFSLSSTTVKPSHSSVVLHLIVASFCRRVSSSHRSLLRRSVIVSWAVEGNQAEAEPIFPYNPSEPSLHFHPSRVRVS